MELNRHGIMSHRKGLKAIPALTAFAISPLLPSSFVRHFSSSDAWEVVAGTPIRCAIPETFSCRLRVAIEGNVIFDTSADWEISTAWRKGECAWKEQTFLQSRGSKIHTGCIYLPFNSF